jgi:hypothetical protein
VQITPVGNINTPGNTPSNSITGIIIIAIATCTIATCT